MRQLMFRVIDEHKHSKSCSTDSMSSLSSISTLSNDIRRENYKTDVLYHLSKAISNDRCLLDKVNYFKLRIISKTVNFLLVVVYSNHYPF